MATKLGLYNGALLLIDERKLASLTENREPRRALDDAYDQALRYCLEQGLWNFAMRAVQIDASASVEPTFGFNNAFTKPDDFIRLQQIADNERFEPPLLGNSVVDEPNYWFANCDPLFVRYVSDDTAYGLDLSIWPATFTNYVEHHLAVRVCKRVTGKEASDSLKNDLKRARADARGKDAMNEPVGFPPAGTWSRSRGGMTSRSRWDGSFR